MAAKKQQPPYVDQPQALNFDAGEQFIASLQQEPPPESSGVMRRALGDSGIALLKGAIGVPETALGLADMVSGGAAGRMAEAAGFRPAEARKILDTYLSPEQQAADTEVQNADGFMGKLGAAVANPSVIVQGVLESLPSVGAGGVVGRSAMAVLPRISQVAAGAIGEGVVTAGQNAEQVREEDPNGALTPGGAAILGLSGGLTAAISRISGGISNKLGIGDIDQLAVAAAGAHGAQKVAADQVQKGIVRKALEGFVTEGVLEELPQSWQEQIAQNIVQGKPLDDGADYAAVMGLLSGGVMGAGAAPFHGGHAQGKNEASPGLPLQGSAPLQGGAPVAPVVPTVPAGDELRAAKVTEVGPMTRALNSAVELAAQKADQGAPIPPESAPLADASTPEGEVIESAPGVADVAAAPAKTETAPPIDFERVLQNMHAWAAQDSKSQRQWDKKGEPAPEPPPAPPPIVEAPTGVQALQPDDMIRPQTPKAAAGPYIDRAAAESARSRVGNPQLYHTVEVAGGYVLRPIKAEANGPLEGNAKPGAADERAVSGDKGVAAQPADATRNQGDAAAPVDGAAESGAVDGTRPGDAVSADAVNAAAPAPKPGSESVAPAPVAAAPHDEDAPSARWTRATTNDRKAVLERAGWAVDDKPSLAAQRMLALPWDKMTDSQRSRIGAALGDTSALPAELAGAAPRYSYGDKQFDLKFANDIDKAAYIAAQPKPSKRDAEYVQHAMTAAGMTEQQGREHGAKVRAAIKEQARTAKPGTLEVPEVTRPTMPPSDTTPQAATEGTARTPAPGQREAAPNVETQPAVSDERAAAAPLIELRKRQSVLESLKECMG